MRKKGPPRYPPWVYIDGDLLASECWPWRGRIDRGGYGIYRGLRAHRSLYELMVKDIPRGLVLDHLCVNAACVNPYHLGPVTQIENARRAAGRRNHCKRGHAYTEQNIRLGFTKSGRRYRACIACEPIRFGAKKQRDRYKAALEKIAASSHDYATTIMLRNFAREALKEPK